jgi:hypothetical protein
MLASRSRTCPSFAGLAFLASVYLCIAGGPVQAIQAQEQDHLRFRLQGDTAGDRLGEAVAVTGDVDRDGCADFIVGAPRDDNNGTDSGTARVYSGADGRILYSMDGDSAGDGFGYSVSGAGDVNLDGYADFIVGAPGDDDNGTEAGSARVFSGKDGKVLWTFHGDTARDLLGSSVSGAGDFNGDGHADLFVGAPQPNKNAPGMARVLSGKDGKILATFLGDSANDEFGTFVRDAGDVNRNGQGDLIVGAPKDDNNGADSGSARVFSGRDGKVLWTFLGDTALDEFGNCVSGAGDVNRDGHADLLVASWNDDRGGLDSGTVFVFSGKDGTTLHSFFGTATGHHFGWRVAAVGDVDGDGHADVMAGKGWYFSTADTGYTQVLSGRTGAVLRSLSGFQVGGGLDMTGDGVPDLVAGAWHLNGMAGTVWVYSGARLGFVGTPHTLPRTTGGRQSLALQPGPNHAGRSYWIFGSITGIKPGVRVLGLDIPLNPDLYTDILIGGPGAPFFFGFQGQLDGNGRASASIVVPAGVPSLTLQHAFVVYDTSGFHLASNPVSLRLQ